MAAASEQKVAARMVVSAVMVLAITKGGRAVHLYRGDVITDDIAPESVEHLRSLGFLADAS